MRRFLLLMMSLFLLAACDPPSDNEGSVLLPTQANPEAVRTALVTTPPPEGFESVAYNPIDHNREQLPSWYFELSVNFDGQLTETGEDVSGNMTLRVWEDNITRARRVVLRFVDEQGVLSGGISSLEAVRFENDFYLLDENGICTQNSEAAREIATLSAAQLVGGTTLAVPTGVSDIINDQQAFQYGFSSENVTINIFREEPSVVDVVGGEVWAFPEFDVAGRFGVSLNVHNAKILFSTTPVTGALNYQYNLYDIGEPTNIALPNGC